MPRAAPTYKVKMNRHRGVGQKRESSYGRSYGGRRWEITRHRIFRRDNYYCKACGDLTILGSRNAARRPHCDHIIDKRKGGTNEDSNLQTLCGSCHSKKSMRERML